MKAIIYQPAKNAMQSGRGKSDLWVLEYDVHVKRGPESLNGWTSSNSTLEQVQVKFTTLEHAQKFAEDKGLDYLVRSTSTRKIRPRNYQDNFKYIPPADK